VAAYYLAALITGTTAAGVTPRVVRRVALQQASFGEPLDDLIIDAISTPDQSQTQRFARSRVQLSP
jgi:hypothetical protein